MSVLLFLIALQVEPIRLPEERAAAARKLQEYAAAGRAADALLEAAGFDARGLLKHPRLRREDLEPLAPLALAEKPVSTELLQAIDRWQLKSSVPRLLKLLEGETEPEIQLRAVCILSRWAEPSQLSLLLRKGWPFGFLVDRETNKLGHRTRWSTLHAAARLKDTPQAAEVLLPLLQDRSSGPQEGAVRMLTILEPAGLAPRMAALGGGGDAKVRIAAVDGLGELRAQDQIELLRKLGRDPWPILRMEAARALFRMGAPGAIDEMLPLLDAEGYTRDMVVEALAEADPAALWAPLSAKGDLEALGALRLPDVAPLLLRGLEAEDPKVRIAAARGIGFFQDPALAPKLLPLLKDPKARTSAVRALVRLRAPLPGPPKDLEDLSAIQHLGDRESLPALVPFLSHASRDFRMAAARAAGGIGGPDAEKALLPLLSDSDRYVRAAAADALGSMGATGALIALRRQLLFDDKDAYLRASVAESLCLLGVRECAPALIEATREASWNGWLVPLNVLRTPGAWKRLAEVPSHNDLEGSGALILERLAKEAGLALKLPDPVQPDQKRWLASRQSRRTLLFAPPRRNPSVRDMLLSVLSYSPFDLVLEEDRIVILERLDAQRFWEAWEHDTR